MITLYHLLWGNANKCLFPLQWECDRGGFTTAFFKLRWYSQSVQVFPVRTFRIAFSQLFLCSFVVITLSVMFDFSARDRKMALLQMATVEEAIQALIDLHNYDMGRGHRLRVSFSKSTIWGTPWCSLTFPLSPRSLKSNSFFYQSFRNTISKTSMRMALKGTLAFYLLLLFVFGQLLFCFRMDWQKCALLSKIASFFCSHWQVIEV